MRSKIKATTTKAVTAKPGKPEVRGDDESGRMDECVRLIADRHGLLIMRELSMNVSRFQDIQLQTKISPHALTSRLRRLEKDGIIERRRYSTKPPRFDYLPTAKGKGLDEFLFAAANWDVLWGNAGAGHEPSLIVYDKKTGTRLGPTPRKGVKKMNKKRVED